MRGVSKVFSNGTLALSDMSLDGRARRVPQPARAVGLRQIDGAADHRRPRRADLGQHRLAELDASIRSGLPRGRYRLRLPGPDADAVGDGVRQCLPAAAPRRRQQRADARPHHGSDAARSSASPISPRPIRASSRAACACASRSPAPSSPSRAPADGRALRRARRDHPAKAQRRRADALAAVRHHGDLRHPFGVRERLSLATGSS